VRWDRVSGVADPTGYLYRTAMNVWRSRRRRAIVALRRVIGLAPERDELAEVEARNDVVRALGVLTPRQRMSLVLVDPSGLLIEGRGAADGHQGGHGPRARLTGQGCAQTGIG
jgi:DNA-directed RNA polymerase specialized sigma24 family protein